MRQYSIISEKLFIASNINKFIKNKYNLLEHNNIKINLKQEEKTNMLKTISKKKGFKKIFTSFSS